jgi:FlaA1/EpsC-like NDP-sugar epimerase
MVRHLLVSQRPSRLVVFSRSEHAQAAMKEEFAALNEEAGNPLRFFLGDIADRDRVFEAMRDVGIVFHAAAMKRIEACEYNSQEALRVNVQGAKTVIDAAIDRGCERVLGISSDKAVSPMTLYGNTKAMMERLFSASNGRSGYDGPQFSTVRYGNVLGSAGSVLPRFVEALMSGRPLPITDINMTRFMWPIDSAIRFTLEAMDLMTGGEVLVPKMKAMRISQLLGGLARAFPGELFQARQVGLRGVEKLHEVLIAADEAPAVHDLDGAYAVAQWSNWQRRYWPTGHSTRLWAGGDYHSGLERVAMSDDEATQMVVDVLRNLYPELFDELQGLSDPAQCHAGTGNGTGAVV